MEDADTLLAANLFASVLSDAIADVRRQSIPVFTFAFYHDHESDAVSVCVDTEENSIRSEAHWNAYRLGYFAKAIAVGDLKEASRWNAIPGRNLELGDFAFVNSVRMSLDYITPGEGFHLAMVRALREREKQIAELSPTPERLLFCCSGPDDEVEYMWSLDSSIR